MKARMRLVFLALVVASTIGCDRVTKHLATTLLADRPTQSFLGDSFRLGYAENAGGFLSLGAELPPAARTALFGIATGAVLVGLLVLLGRSRWSWWPTLGVALFVGGGLSNWAERLVRGSVVDFMNLGIGWLRTGVFNFADVAIMLGVALIVFADVVARSKPNRWRHRQ